MSLAVTLFPWLSAVIWYSVCNYFFLWLILPSPSSSRPIHSPCYRHFQSFTYRTAIIKTTKLYKFSLQRHSLSSFFTVTGFSGVDFLSETWIFNSVYSITSGYAGDGFSNPGWTSKFFLGLNSSLTAFKLPYIFCDQWFWTRLDLQAKATE